MPLLKLGRPRKGVTLIERFFAKVRKTRGCWYWIGYSSNGRYGHIKDGGKRLSAHEVSFMYHNNLSERPEGIILHTCDEPRCVNPKHLYVGTQRENMRDALVRGRHGRVKITVKDANWCVGKPIEDIVAKFGVLGRHARGLSKGVWWKGLLCPS